MKFNSAMSDGLHIKVADMTRIVLKCATIVTRRSAMKGAARRFLMKANTASAKWEIRLRSHFYVLQRVPISMLIRENTILHTAIIFGTAHLSIAMLCERAMN